VIVLAQPVDNLEYKKVLDAVGMRKKHLIFPIFIQERHRERSQIIAMPGIARTPLKKVTQQVHAVINAGISSIVIFGIPENRDERGSFAVDKNGIVQQALRRIRKEFGNKLNVITDVCICQYNFSGQCGLVNNNKVDNDSTLDLISKIALSHAEAGADAVAPSSMMDGQVYSVRKLLRTHGFQKTKILSHSVKQLSSLYTPFRSAAFSKKCQFNNIDKSSYQIACSNPRQILREVEADINEGADMVMVKPGVLSLDVVCMIKEKFGFPIAVQNVSGEYAMIKAAAMYGWIEEEFWKVTSVASIKRAGADRIISYFSMDLARYLED
jgi:porphobilinogen synthase